MASEIKCDVCGKYVEACTDNTTQKVTINEKALSVFVKISTSQGVKDICSACFAATLEALSVETVSKSVAAQKALEDKLKKVTVK